MTRTALLALMLALPMVGCNGKTSDDDTAPTGGAAGTDGTDGTDGADGTDGTGGTDGTESALPQPDFSQPPAAEDLDPADDVVHLSLRAAPATHTITDWVSGEVYSIDGYAYNDQLPGPTIRASVGDTVIIDFENALDVATTIHWHGLAVPYAMDGVTWTTAPIGPGDTFTYTFTVDRAGTFWYHPHFDTKRQVDLGLYGVLIVEDPSEPAVDHDLVMIVDDWGEVEGTDGDPSIVHGAHGEIGRWAINGVVRPRLEVAGGDTVRARILNVSNHGYLDLTMPDLRRIAGGQGILGALSEPDSVVLPPGGRVELELLPGESDLALEDRPYSLNGGAGVGDNEVLLDIAVTAPASAASGLGWPFEPAAPSVDGGRTDVLYTFQGEAHTSTWRINGEAFPDVTVESLDLGQDAVIEVRNLSASEHPFHLHGLYLEVLSRDGVVPPIREIVDTINIPIHQAFRMRVLADNVGFWMAHCHILPHAEGGMMTVLQVAEP